MKTSNLILVTAIMFFASVGFSYTESPVTKVNHEITQDNALITISIKSAAHMPYLAKAIHGQVTPHFVNGNYYIFHVIVHQQHYMVHGCCYDWKVFFRLPPNTVYIQHRLK